MSHGAAISTLLARLEAMGILVGADLAARLVSLLARMAAEPQNLTAIRDLQEAVDRHLADSLCALLLPEVRSASTLIDLGSGGGFPGIPLAGALPDATVTLVESERRKAQWLERCREQFPNLRVVADRSENLALAHREQWEVATVRAVAAPAVALELAAPLVAPGGAVVLWRSLDGDAALDRDAAAAAAALGLVRGEPEPVIPFPGARRLLDRYRKLEPTPTRFPRRPGMAAKRPLGVGS
jgi:16S rRNA (guanine527-N7)-methyltransferase